MPDYAFIKVILILVVLFVLTAAIAAVLGDFAGSVSDGIEGYSTVTTEAEAGDGEYTSLMSSLLGMLSYGGGHYTEGWGANIPGAIGMITIVIPGFILLWIAFRALLALIRS